MITIRTESLVRSILNELLIEIDRVLLLRPLPLTQCKRMIDRLALYAPLRIPIAKRGELFVSDIKAHVQNQVGEMSLVSPSPNLIPDTAISKELN